ncbi:MAG: hypothetical protein ACI9R3_005833 [Verrucomicrobiales bacterium]|jgi:hypothetical protein
MDLRNMRTLFIKSWLPAISLVVILWMSAKLFGRVVELRDELRSARQFAGDTSETRPEEITGIRTEAIEAEIGGDTVRTIEQVLADIEVLLEEHPIEKKSLGDSRHWQTIRALDNNQLEELLMQIPNRFSGPISSALTGIVSLTLAERAPERMLALADGKNVAHRSALQRWATEDYRAALDWLDSNQFRPGGATWNRDYLLGQIVPIILPKNPDKALEILDGLQAADFSGWNSAFEHACLSASTFEARRRMEAFIHKIDDEKSQETGWLALAKSIKWSNGFEEAARYLQDSLPSERASPLIASLFKDIDIGSDPARKAQWIINNTPQQNRPETIRSVISEWTKQDYNSAGRWLATMTPDPTMDPAVAEFSAQIAAIDEEAAEAWLGLIDDTSLRAEMRRKLLGEHPKD